MLLWNVLKAGCEHTLPHVFKVQNKIKMCLFCTRFNCQMLQLTGNLQTYIWCVSVICVLMYVLCVLKRVRETSAHEYSSSASLSSLFFVFLFMTQWHRVIHNQRQRVRLVLQDVHPPLTRINPPPLKEACWIHYSPLCSFPRAWTPVICVCVCVCVCFTSISFPAEVWSHSNELLSSTITDH